MAGAILISAFGCANGLFFPARASTMPWLKTVLSSRAFAKLHPTHKTAAVSLMVQMVCVPGWATEARQLSTTLFLLAGVYILRLLDVCPCAEHVLTSKRPYRAVVIRSCRRFNCGWLVIDVVLLRTNRNSRGRADLVLLASRYITRVEKAQHKARIVVVPKEKSKTNGKSAATKPLNLLMEEPANGRTQPQTDVGSFSTDGAGRGCGNRGRHFCNGGTGSTVRGPGLTLSFVLSGFGCAFAGLCYAEFAAMIRWRAAPTPRLCHAGRVDDGSSAGT